MLRLLTCGLLVSAMALSADVLIEDFENTLKKDGNWTNFGEEINKVMKKKYVGYWWFWRDSDIHADGTTDGGGSYMVPPLNDSASSYKACHVDSAGPDKSVAWHQTWHFVQNKAEYTGMGLGFSYLEGDLVLDMSKLTKVSFYAKGTEGSVFEFEIATKIKNGSFKNSVTITSEWKKYSIPISEFTNAEDIKWDVAKTQGKTSMLAIKGVDQDIREFWLDSLVFEGMVIDDFLTPLQSPVKNPLSKLSNANEFSVNTSGRTPSITFNLKSEEKVNLSILDLNGRHVATLADGIFSSGSHSIAVDKNIVSTGSYVVNMTRGNSQSTGLLTIK